jgi:hypothetical protein
MIVSASQGGYALRLRRGHALINMPSKFSESDDGTVSDSSDVASLRIPTMSKHFRQEALDFYVRQQYERVELHLNLPAYLLIPLYVILAVTLLGLSSFFIPLSVSARVRYLGGTAISQTVLISEPSIHFLRRDTQLTTLNFSGRSYRILTVKTVAPDNRSSFNLCSSPASQKESPFTLIVTAAGPPFAGISSCSTTVVSMHGSSLHYLLANGGTHL